jgi:predicted membrane-bound spermidine synthase
MIGPQVSRVPEVIERSVTPRGEIQLQRRGEHYEIISNGVFLIATYNGESERVLVTAALDAVGGATVEGGKAGRELGVLLGGLGVGFSLGAALADPRVARATVVEVEPRVIAWNRSHLAPFSAHGLDDHRTHVVQEDLVRWLHQADAGERFDAICLDVDNGPDWTVTDGNRGLYTDAGLVALRRRLRPGGVLSVWSAGPAPRFAARLGRHFMRVQAIAVQDAGSEARVVERLQGVDERRVEPSWIYLASLDPAGSAGSGGAVSPVG